MAHQLGEDVFRSVLPDDVDREPFSAFQPTARLAVVVGGEYVTQVTASGPISLEYVDQADDPRNQ